MSKQPLGLRDRSIRKGCSTIANAKVTVGEAVDAKSKQRIKHQPAVISAIQNQHQLVDEETPSTLSPFLENQDKQFKRGNGKRNGFSLLNRIARLRHGIGGEILSFLQTLHSISYCSQHWWTSRKLFNLLTVIVFICDPPFIVYGMIFNVWLYQICRACCWHCHPWNPANNDDRQSHKDSPTSSSEQQQQQRPIKLFLPFAIVIMIIISLLATKYEVNQKRVYKYDLTNVTRGGGQHFYRMIPTDNSYGTQFVDYIEMVSDYMQQKSTISLPTTKRHIIQIEQLPVSNVKTFDNAIRFDFLLDFRNNPLFFEADFGCLMETDFVVDTTYIINIMTTAEENYSPPDFLYVQHMWAHRKFEYQNVGLLCVRNKDKKKKKTTTTTITKTYIPYANYDYFDTFDMWLRLMSFLNNRRYCRLLPKSLLYWFMPVQSRILYWDIDHGCSMLYDHCNYIHFTKPKGPGITQAVRYIDKRKKERRKIQANDISPLYVNGLKGVMPGMKRPNEQALVVNTTSTGV